MIDSSLASLLPLNSSPQTPPPYFCPDSCAHIQVRSCVRNHGFSKSSCHTVTDHNILLLLCLLTASSFPSAYISAGYHLAPSSTNKDPTSNIVWACQEVTSSHHDSLFKRLGSPWTHVNPCWAPGMNSGCCRVSRYWLVSRTFLPLLCERMGPYYSSFYRENRKGKPSVAHPMNLQ